MSSPFRPELALSLRRGLREAELSKLLFGESSRRRYLPRNVRIAWIPAVGRSSYADTGRVRFA
jgi:hypothetical protein